VTVARFVKISRSVKDDSRGLFEGSNVLASDRVGRAQRYLCLPVFGLGQPPTDDRHLLSSCKENQL
jgi:hypothetical protein